ncbi:MAG: helix-turn-helix transcriptional regulator [Hyphomicrobiaceae bacterium]
MLETIPRGSIYTVLNRLEKDGWVSSRYQKVPGLQTRPLRFFKLTKMGKEIVRMDAQLATDVKTKGHLS